MLVPARHREGAFLRQNLFAWLGTCAALHVSKELHRPNRGDLIHHCGGRKKKEEEEGGKEVSPLVVQVDKGS